MIHLLKRALRSFFTTPSSDMKSSNHKTPSQSLYGGRGYGTTYTRSTCHSGNNKVWTIRRHADDPDDVFTIWAGGQTRGAEPLGGTGAPFDLIIGPDHVVSRYERSHTYPTGWHTSAFYEEPTPVLALPWPDFSIPEVPDMLWAALVEDLLDGHVNNLFVMCQGGHGRTGTALTILTALILPQRFDTIDEYVEELRDIYCENIVENSAQLEYAAEIADKPFTGEAAGSKTHVQIGGSHQYSWWDKGEDEDEDAARQDDDPLDDAAWDELSVGFSDSFSDWMVLNLGALRDYLPEPGTILSKGNCGERWHALLQHADNHIVTLRRREQGIEVEAGGTRTLFATMQEAEADLGLTDDDYIQYYDDTSYGPDYMRPVTEVNNVDAL